MELNMSSRTSLIESKIIINAGFLASRVCEGQVLASTDQETRDGIAASYPVGQQIQSFIQNIRGFGEEKLPDRCWAAGVPGAITGQQLCQLLRFQCWQLRGGKAEWRQVSKGGENPLGFYQDSCEEPLVSHRGTGKLSNRVVTETSAHLATVEEQLHGCAVRVQKQRSSLRHDNTKMLADAEGEIVI